MNSEYQTPHPDPHVFESGSQNVYVWNQMKDLTKFLTSSFVGKHLK